MIYNTGYGIGDPRILQWKVHQVVHGILSARVNPIWTCLSKDILIIIDIMLINVNYLLSKGWEYVWLAEINHSTKKSWDSWSRNAVGHSGLVISGTPWCLGSWLLYNHIFLCLLICRWLLDCGHHSPGTPGKMNPHTESKRSESNWTPISHRRGMVLELWMLLKPLDLWPVTTHQP